MNKKEEYINAMLLENIEITTKSIVDIKEENEEIDKLPNNCLDIIIDGVVCKNNNFKIDLTQQNYHVLGYMESLKKYSTELLNLRTMDDDEFDQYILDQETVKKNNDKEIQKINEYNSQHKN